MPLNLNESMARQQDLHNRDFNSDEDMNTKDDRFSGFNVKDSFDSPPMGESSTQSEAQRSEKARMIGSLLPEGERSSSSSSSSKTSYDFNCRGTSYNNWDNVSLNPRESFELEINILKDHIYSIMSDIYSTMNNMYSIMNKVYIIMDNMVNIVYHLILPPNSWRLSPRLQAIYKASFQLIFFSLALIPWMVPDVNISWINLKSPVYWFTILAILSFWIFRRLQNSRETITERNLNMNRANMQKASSWIIVLTFPWCLLLSSYRHSLLNDQRSLSIWLALLGMFNFTAFLSSLFLMVISEAHFTRMQIITLLISAMIMNTYITGSTVPVYVPVLGILFAGSFARA